VNRQDSSRIYLDYAATTPLRAEAAGAMQLALRDAAFNPSSLHAEGRRSRAVLDDARDRVARVVGANRKDVTFTGGGSEADSLAIFGTVRAERKRARRHVITTAIEHHAVLAAVEALAAERCDATILPVRENGTVDPAEFAAALRDDTVLATVMYVNNEIGTIQPIAELAALARERGVAFHTDAIQAPLWLPIDVRELGVDLLTLSAHKVFGPKGVGALVGRAPLEPLVRGGGQEFGRRAGTENVAGIAAFAQALELAVEERAAAAARVRTLRDRLEAGIVETIGDVRVNGAGAPRLPNVLNVSIAGVDSEALLLRLDLDGIAASAGSACTSGVLEPSHVIGALGLEERWTTGAVRFSLGPPTTQAEIDRAVAIVSAAVRGLRRAGSKA
jgi:cysteine desulfurase